MKKKLIMVILFCLLFVAISGCKGIIINTYKEIDFRKGSEGIVMQFVNKAPGKTVDNQIRVFEESPIPIELRIENKGAFSVTEGILTLGIEEDFIQVANMKGSGNFLKSSNTDSAFFDLYGKSAEAIVGESGVININAKSKKIGSQSESHTSLLIASSCYQYNTILGINVCIEPDTSGTRATKKACVVKNLEFGSGQGAPVAVTKIESQIINEESDKVVPLFTIHIENIGNGEVVKKDKYKTACSREDDTASQDRTYYNTVLVKASLSNQELDCSIYNDNEQEQIIGIVKLKDKKGIARCILKSSNAINKNLNAYLAPLYIELEYGYTNTISKQIVIEKTLI